MEVTLVNLLRHSTVLMDGRRTMTARRRRSVRVGPIRDTSLLYLLYQRETETDCYRAERISCRLVHEVTLRPSMQFTPAWQRESHKHVCIGLDRRIYFENHQICYFNDGFGGVPHQLYRLPARGPLAIKIWAVLLYHGHIRRHPCTPEEQEVCLLVLTADGYLKVLNADTGAVLKSVFLSTAIKFRYLLWADYLTTVQVKSTQINRPLPSPRRGGGNSGVPLPPQSPRLMVIALFRIHPLELVTCVPIDKNIFGNDVSDASVNEDLLIVVHTNKTYRFYSLEWITKHCTIVEPRLGATVTVAGHIGDVGSTGFGIPVTVDLTEPPPLLFETKSGADCGVSFGGAPTVFVHNGIPSSESVFHVRSLQTRRLIGHLSTDTVAFHHDVAEFHFDDYQRLLHISGCNLSCYHLCHEFGKDQRLTRQYSVDFKALHQKERVEMPVRTSSGRTVKRRRCTENEFDDFTSAIQDLDYENEVEVLYAVVTLPEGDEGTLAQLCFVDDKTGRITKKVPLPTWKPGVGNSIYYELDCIIHLVQDGGQSICHYYRLSRTA